MTALRSLALPTVAACLLVALAGCSTGGTKDGTFTLGVADALTDGRLDLEGVYLRGADGDWVAALGNATLDFTGSGENVTASGDVPAGTYDGVRVLFQALHVGDRSAELAQSGIDLAVNLTVEPGGATDVQLAIAWADALFESSSGLAFEPVLSRVVVTVDGTETLRLDATAIGGGVAPVARMRIFDATGLEAFASTFVADSPETPVVANAGELVLSATGSEALLPGASVAKYAWDVDGTPLEGSTVRHVTPIDGGNITIRLTVTDSEGGSDAQTVKVAVKPGFAQRSFNFTGSVSGGTVPGLGTEGAAEHPFGPINAAELDGAPARLVHVTATLEPGSSALPVSDLDFAVVDGAGAEVAVGDGSGSQHRIDEDIGGTPGDGQWAVVVTPQQALEAEYTVTVTLTWQGVNPGMEAFLASFEDGHSHQH